MRVRHVAGFFCCSVFFCPNGLLAGPTEDFLARAKRNATAQEAVPERLSVSPGQVGFLSMTELVRGQDQISVDNIFAKMREKEALGDFRAPSGQPVSLSHDGGRSAVPLGDPIQVIKGPSGYLVIDGHHDLYLSFYLGAKTIAVDVKEDLSGLSKLEFWSRLRERRLTYLKATPEKLSESPPRFHEVTDNPNRYLASLLAFKVTVAETITKKKGTPLSAWVKVNDSIPFIEFEIADILSRAGIQYSPEWGTAVPERVVEAARKALHRAKISGEFPNLQQLTVFRNRDDAAAAMQSDETLLERIRYDVEGPYSAKSCGRVLAKFHGTHQ